MPNSYFTLNINNIKFHYFLQKSDQAPRQLAVFIHGLASNHTRWLEFIEQTTLRDHMDILAVDLRGHGESLTRSVTSLEIWADDIATIIQHEGYPSAVFIGHSLGAHVAVFIAKQYPQYVLGLVLIDPLNSQALPPTLRFLRQLRYIAQAMVATIRFLNQLGIHRRHLPARDLRELDKDARQMLVAGKLKEMAKVYGSPWLDLKYNPIANYVQYSLEAIRPLPSLKTNNFPILLITSGNSTYSMSKRPHPLSNQLKHCTVRTIECNHWPLTEKPEDVLRFIEEWFAIEFETKFAK